LKNTKILLIGIDQSIPYLINKFLDDGILPNIKKLINTGVYGEAYSCPPCDTPTNWTTIATGATTAVHGVTSFYMHLTGEPLDFGMRHRSRTQLSKNCKAEYIWNVAQNNGLTPFIMNYPSGWPGVFKKGAMSLYSWSMPESLPRTIQHSFRVELKLEQTPSSFSKFGSNSTILSANLSLNKQINEQEITIKIYVYEVNGSDQIAIELNDHIEYLEFKPQRWSQWIYININTIYGLLSCIFRLKFLKIDKDKSKMDIECSALYNLKGWTNPELLAEKLIKNVFEYDLPEEHEVEFMIYGSMKKFLRSAREESKTLARSVIYIQKELNWDLCYFHYHPLDTINHSSLAFLYNRSPLYSEEKAGKTLENVQLAYKIVDEMVGDLIKGCVNEHTIVFFVSDHGAMPIWKIVNIPSVFSKAGLIQYNWNSNEKKYIIDWKNSVTFPYMDPPFVWVNLENRDPHGIVKQKDYEEIRDKIIDTLYKIKDPETNERVIQLALKKEEASEYGLNGDRIGDVIYFLKPSYGLFDGDLSSLDSSSITKRAFKGPICDYSRIFFGAHSYYLPEAKLGDYSISVPLIINGPGIKKGITIENKVELIDLAPTIAHLLKIPVPRDCQGSILHDIFI
jgi:predicted AlkP superfamily phosphohydrolase/phosphomutase